MLPISTWRLFSAQTSSLCLFVRASALRSTERWTLTCPIPASLSFTVPAQKNENGYEESFCLYGGDTLNQIFLSGVVEGTAQALLENRLNKLCRATKWSFSPWGQIWFYVAFYFGLAALLVVLHTRTQSQMTPQVRLFVCYSGLCAHYCINPSFPSLGAQWRGGQNWDMQLS